MIIGIPCKKCGKATGRLNPDLFYGLCFECFKELVPPSGSFDNGINKKSR